MIKLVKNRLSRKAKKPLSHPRKHYRLSLCIAICSSRLFAEAEFGWNIRKLWPCTHARWLLWGCSSLLAVQVCVVPRNTSFVFCGCSLLHAATVSCSLSRLLTTPISISHNPKNWYLFLTSWVALMCWYRVVLHTSSNLVYHVSSISQMQCIVGRERVSCMQHSCCTCN